MKKVLLSLLFVAALSGTALAAGNHEDHDYDRCDKVRVDDHSKDVEVTCEAPIVTCPPQFDIEDLKAACSVAVTCPEAPACICPEQPSCPTITVPACPEAPKVECPESSVEGVYQLCKLRTDGSRKCRRLGVYKLFKSDGGYEQ